MQGRAGPAASRADRGRGPRPLSTAAQCKQGIAEGTEQPKLWGARRTDRARGAGYLPLCTGLGHPLCLAPQPFMRKGPTKTECDIDATYALRKCKKCPFGRVVER